MAVVGFTGSSLPTPLMALLNADAIQPGTDPSYQVCKEIFLYHPLGQKMAEAPIAMAQSQKRIIAVPAGPAEMCIEAFWEEWDKLGADRFIYSTVAQARVYGIASLAMVAQGVPVDRPVDLKALADATLAFKVFDPLNTAGSLVLNQDTDAFDFQMARAIAVNGKNYHPSRSIVVMNGMPIYIAYTSSSFGFVGRSVYQRALFPLKSYIQTLITDDLVSRKAGIIVAKMKPPGSIISGLMQSMAGVKRALLKEAEVTNVLSIDVDEDITTLNMQNLDGAYGQARTNILKNIATAADMPAMMLENETMVSGFGEGTEDAKNVARYIDRIRTEAAPLYNFMDRVAMRRAWNPAFFERVKRTYPDEYSNKTHQQAFYEWSNSFTAAWPNLLEEPDSEKSKQEDVELKALISAVEVLLPILDPANKAVAVQWMADNMNEKKLMFTHPLDLDYDALAEYEPPSPLSAPGEPGEPKPFAAQDSEVRKAMGVIEAYRRKVG